MKTERVVDGETTLAIIVRGGDWEDGLNFVSSDADFQQVGAWVYDSGKILQPHIHLKAPREVHHTQEVVFVRAGRLRADVYDMNRALKQSVELATGDCIILLNGGHGYQIMENGTQVLEVKNGPYVGADRDRARI